MKARICDKCKAVMEYHPGYPRGKSPTVYTILTKIRCWEDDELLYALNGKVFDICKDCLKDLYKYMEGDSNEN